MKRTRRSWARRSMLAAAATLLWGCGSGTQYECYRLCAGNEEGGTLVSTSGGNRAEAEQNCVKEAPSSCSSPTCTACNVTELPHP